jgi:hypothetical protein
MSQRGTYRGIFSAMVDDPDFQALSPQARHVFLTLRVSPQLGPAGIFRYYPAVQTGLDGDELAKALTELEAHFWVVREGPILWLRNALLHDPSIRLSDMKHRKTVEKWVAGLPKLGIVLTFCEYYKITRPFEGPTKALRRPCAQESESETESGSESQSKSEPESEPEVEPLRSGGMPPAPPRVSLSVDSDWINSNPQDASERKRLFARILEAKQRGEITAEVADGRLRQMGYKR